MEIAQNQDAIAAFEQVLKQHKMRYEKALIKMVPPEGRFTIAQDLAEANCVEFIMVTTSVIHADFLDYFETMLSRLCGAIAKKNKLPQKPFSVSNPTDDDQTSFSVNTDYGKREAGFRQILAQVTKNLPKLIEDTKALPAIEWKLSEIFGKCNFHVGKNGFVFKSVCNMALGDSLKQTITGLFSTDVPASALKKIDVVTSEADDNAPYLPILTANADLFIPLAIAKKIVALPQERIEALATQLSTQSRRR